MHHQMSIGYTRVNLLDALNRQDIACGRASEFLSAVAGSDSNGERIHGGLLYKLRGFFGIGQ